MFAWNENMEWWNWGHGIKIQWSMLGDLVEAFFRIGGCTQDDQLDILSSCCMCNDYEIQEPVYRGYAIASQNTRLVIVQIHCIDYQVFLLTRLPDHGTTVNSNTTWPTSSHS